MKLAFGATSILRSISKTFSVSYVSVNPKQLKRKEVSLAGEQKDFQILIRICSLERFDEMTYYPLSGTIERRGLLLCCLIKYSKNLQ